MHKHSALRPGVALQPQQRRVAEHPGSLLVYHGLGSGKTLAALAAAHRDGRPYVAALPASLVDNFRKEEDKHSDGAPKSAPISFSRLALGQRPPSAPGVLIVDEAHRLRNPASGAARGVRELSRGASRVLALTATPVVNGPGDLAPLLGLVGGPGMDPGAFERRYLGWRVERPGLLGRLLGRAPEAHPYVKRERELLGLWRGRVDYHPGARPEGVSRRSERVEVPLSPEQARLEGLLWQRVPRALRWKLRSEFPLTDREVSNLSSFLTGPRQAALSTYPFLGEGAAPESAFATSAKLRRARSSLVRALGDERAKALVFSNFVDAALVPYLAGLRRSGIPAALYHGGMPAAERSRALADYNAGKVRALLLSPAGAEGISTKGTQLIQLLDPHWNAARGAQAEGRGIRLDSHLDLPEDLRRVRVQRFIAQAKGHPTADQILERMAERKRRVNEMFLRVLRRAAAEGRAKGASIAGAISRYRRTHSGG